jgi:hypothetical protein
MAPVKYDPEASQRFGRLLVLSDEITRLANGMSRALPLRLRD